MSKLEGEIFGEFVRRVQADDSIPEPVSTALASLMANDQVPSSDEWAEVLAKGEEEAL